MSRPLQNARIVIWTVLLGLSFVALDRLVFGPLVREGWAKISSVQDLRGDLLRLPPVYLPESLKWPPQLILERSKPEPGLWLGLSDTAGGGISLWIGVGTIPFPKELLPYRACMTEQDLKGCPAGWHFASAQGKKVPLYVFSRLDAQETKRIVLGLETGL